MSNYTQQQIDERYEKLPDVLKDAMFSPDIADKMVEVGKKSGLTLDKIGEIAEETGYVVLGLTAPKDFVKALEARLEKDAGKAPEIAKEINHQIFYPLREELKKAHNIEITTEELEKKEPLMRPAPPRPAPAPTIPPKPATAPIPPLPAREAGLSAGSPTSIRPPSFMPKPPTPPAPTPHPLPDAQSAKGTFPAKGEGGIFFETKSRVPPIDLRPSRPSTLSQSPQIPPASNAINLKPPEEPRTEPPTVAPPPAEKKPFQGNDPYREPPE